jgi:hypothetical protein
MAKFGALIFGGLFLSCALSAHAQRVPPFFSGGAAAFEPQIGIVNSGVVQDAQAVVSHDLKYVTLNMQVQNSNLLALQEFTFQRLPPLGIVGLPQTIILDTKNSRQKPANVSSLMTSPSEIKRLADSWILEREGMFRVGEAP